jgi:hypothetical protein
VLIDFIEPSYALYNNSKGWKFEEIATRWNKSERQLSRIAKAEEPRDIDAVNGLPDKKSSK